MTEEKEITLKVLEAYTRDVGRGIIRIDYDCMDELKCETGNVVEIKGNKIVVGKCLPIYPSDEGKGLVRIDGLMRDNGDLKIGDDVKIKKIIAHPCVSFSVLPLEAIPPIDDRYLADALEDVVIIKGQKIMIPYFGGRLSFVVEKTEPDGAVIVKQKTIPKILDEVHSHEELQINDLLQEKREFLIKKLEPRLRANNMQELAKILCMIGEMDYIKSLLDEIFKGYDLKEKPQFNTWVLELLDEELNELNKPQNDGENENKDIS